MCRTRPAWRPTDIRLCNASGPMTPGMRRRRHHSHCYCFPSTDVAALRTFTPDTCTHTQHSPTAARHNLHQMHRSLQWAGGLHASVGFHLAEGAGSNVHWIKCVVLVNYQRYLVQIKRGESHVWVVGFFTPAASCTDLLFYELL